MNRNRGDQCPGVVSSSFVIAKSWRLKDHPRWMFRKNSMEFFVGLLNYLYKFCRGYATTNPWSHILLEYSTITWPCHMIWLPKFPHLFIAWLCCVTWCCQSSFQMRGKFFPLWGSHNTLAADTTVLHTPSFRHYESCSSCVPRLYARTSHTQHLSAMFQTSASTCNH